MPDAASLRSVIFDHVQDVTDSPPARPMPNPPTGTVSDCVNGVALSLFVSEAVVLESPVAFQMTMSAAPLAASVATIFAVVPVGTDAAKIASAAVVVPSHKSWLPTWVADMPPIVIDETGFADHVPESFPITIPTITSRSPDAVPIAALVKVWVDVPPACSRCVT